ncbi:helix-turn-helix domain-containing protein [Streptomyces clavuligerus]|uniref:Putative transcriptional regulator n=1 Tax=Streptomyces clavuligerus TaxID=1901 RepID=B5H2L0_STRCL|nr:helix-turn-helix transcriptional regulator [Streptomyces clavuligerus]ANW21301.1 transcriptional regulator [Streptomyces clavuligerus]AXU15929.1 XRE family transcriptional regulator [Streptomyces clavuligerus]EDY52806.1 transcriptional regulator [Streptomyces clavuligerus]EFG05577.1 Putative transcriptional regulator [Streptomyces clavuligerus]MBY6306055.1 helix-turn-helix transcriptional regulator [Streptomyces clavuligerus]
MPHSQDDHIGARIADYRKLRHLTQAGLAQRAGVSRTTVAKIEAGLSPATPPIVAAVARVLEVDVAVLNGQPYLSELQADHLDRMIAPLSDALDLYDLGPDPDITPRPMHRIAADVDRLCAQACATEYRYIGTRLPALLGELTTAFAVLPAADRQRTAATLGWAYWTAYEFAYRLGYHDLATIALERMGWMAEQAQDPLLLALRHRHRSAMLLRRGKSELALRVLDRAHHLVGQHEAPRSVEALAVSGTLHLAGAIAAAQAADDSAVDGYLGLARRTSEAIGRDVPTVYWASFGETNVQHFSVASSVQLGHLGQAMKAARTLVFPADHPRMRVGRYHIEMAQAYARMGKAEAAENALHQARRVAPQQARYHPLVRETIAVLVRRRRRAPDGLAALARWVGM